MKKTGLIIVLFCFIYGCSPTTGSVLYKPVPADATGTVSYEHLVEGRKLYVNHCASCHNLKLPQTLTPEKWKAALDKMQERAKITDEQKQTILDFLLVKAKNPS